MSLKSIERGWRRLWIAIIAAVLRATGSRTPPDWRERGGGRPHRVLFLRHDRIGDMIVSTGVLRAIARSHPGIVLDVLASPANAPVLRDARYVHETVVFDRKRPRGYAGTMLRLRRTRYDAVIDCMVTAPSLTTLLLMLASGARHRVGIAGRGVDSVLTVPVPPRERDGHMVELLGQLAVGFGIDPGGVELRPHVDLSDEEQRWGEAQWDGGSGGAPAAGRLLVNVSSGTGDRRWPDDRFAAAIRAAAAAAGGGIGVVVIGSPADRARGEWIARQAGEGARHVETPGVRHAFALVASSTLVLTPDTSIVHAASAFRKPAVAMYTNSGKQHRWGPYGVPARIVASAGPTLESLTVEAVSDALRDLLGRGARAAAGSRQEVE